MCLLKNIENIWKLVAFSHSHATTGIYFKILYLFFSNYVLSKIGIAPLYLPSFSLSSFAELSISYLFL